MHQHMEDNYSIHKNSGYQVTRWEIRRQAEFENMHRPGYVSARSPFS